MDWQPFINAALGVSASVVGWFARQLWYATMTLKDDLNKLQVKLAEEYVSNHRLEETIGRIESMLNRLLDKIEMKVDK